MNTDDFGGGTSGAFFPGISVIGRTGLEPEWSFSTSDESFGDGGNMVVESLAGSSPYLFAGTLNPSKGTEVWMRVPTAIERVRALLGRNFQRLQQERLRIRSCRIVDLNPGICPGRNRSCSSARSTCC